MIKLPRNFNKMTISEQETFLVKKLTECYSLEQEIRNMLSKIRGGQRIKVNEIERPDEAMLKNEN